MKTPKIPLEVHLISDLQKSGMPPGFADLRLDSDTALIFHPIASEVANWTVEGVTAPQRIYDPKRVRIQATIAGFDTPAAKRNVTLLLNGENAAIEDRRRSASGRAQVNSWDSKPPTASTKAKSASTPPTLCRPTTATSSQSSAPIPRRSCLSMTAAVRARELYFRTALDASADAAFQMEVQRPEAAANANLRAMRWWCWTIWAHLPAGPRRRIEALCHRRRLRSGGAGTRPRRCLPRVPVLDEAIDATRYAGREGERFLTVTDFDAGHPALHNVDRLDGVKFYQAIRVTATKSQVLAQLNDGTPLVLERQIGEGKVLAFASTFDNVSNDLPLHASWVPFVAADRGVLGRRRSQQPVNLPVDSYVELRTGDTAARRRSRRSAGPRRKRVLSLEEAATARNFQLNREGFYRSQHRQRPAQPGRRPCRSPGIGSFGDAQGDPGSVESHRFSRSNDGRRRCRQVGRREPTKPWSLWPDSFIVIVRSSGGRIGSRGPVLAAVGRRHPIQDGD